MRRSIRRTVCIFISIIMCLLGSVTLTALVYGETIPLQEPENLLVNPDWDEGMSGWVVQADNANANHNGEIMKYFSAYQDVPLAEPAGGQKLILSAMLRREPYQKSIEMGLILCKSDGSHISELMESESGTEWTQHEIVTPVPSEASYARVYLTIWKENEDRIFGFRDLTFTEIQTNVSTQQQDGSSQNSNQGTEVQPETPPVPEITTDTDLEITVRRSSKVTGSQVADDQTSEAPVIPPDAQYYNGHYYKRYNADFPPYAAQEFCAEQGGYLVTISDEAENEFVNTFKPANGGAMWIGGTDVGHAGTWTWVNGDPWVYENWDSREDAYKYGEGMSYALMYYSGMWSYEKDRDWEYSPIISLEGEAYDDQSGAVSGDPVEAGYASLTENEGWLCYHSIDFGQNSSNFGSVFQVNASCDNPDGCEIDICLDSPDSRIGSCSIPYTEGQENWYDFTSIIGFIEGVHDLYLVYKGSDGNHININIFKIILSNSYCNSFVCEWDPDAVSHPNNKNESEADTDETGNSVTDEERMRSLVEQGKGYYFGTGLEGYNRDKAYECFREAAEADYGEGWFYYGNLLINSIAEERYERAMGCYERAADLGFGLGYVGMGMMYNAGMGTGKDYAKAYELYNKAVDEGYAEGYCGLGELYQEGNGVPQDGLTAMEYYKMALESNDFMWRNFAKCQIANMYMEDGSGIGQDYSKAYDWYKKAADERYGYAYSRIGYMYYYGLGVDKDRAQALTWFENAAAYGDISGMYNAAFMLSHDVGVAQDHAKSFSYYLQAANMGDGDSMYALGVMYAEGNGTAQDYDRAEYWLELALEFTEDSDLRDKASQLLSEIREVA